MYKPFSFTFLLLVISFCLLELAKGQFFAKTSKSIPRMGRRSSPEVPASSRQFEPREMKRAFDGDYYSKSDLYSNALPALRINENTLADYLSSSSANSNVESIEKSAKLIELLKQLNAMNEIN